MELRIKDLCKQKKIGLQELADKLGISRQALHKTINNNPTLERLEEIAKALDCEIFELISGNSDFDHFYDSNGDWQGIRRI